ncbi:pseudouridine synthase [Xanthocytophaga agilis]|uniref:Pseudouridine synthase n=1 Tax=Xanthocytophaga agilis TaxID=3048010 RepID=A0AAE3QXP6_9BACT|nr:pseudouridine synthase [Xanthocytophaga agilis]MDJ1499941.1 pseudouridine synthase [Xanthocytophaga agilis]
MRKKENASGSFRSQKNDNRPSKSFSNRKSTSNRNSNEEGQQSFGKRTEFSDKRKSTGGSSFKDRRSSSNFSNDKPFKKSFRKSEEGDDNRKSSFRRGEEKKEFGKKPSNFRKRNEGESERSFNSDKPFNREKKSFDRSDKPFNRDKKSFDRSDKSFDRSFKSDKPFNREKRAFNKSDKPFSDEKKSFDRPSNSDRPFNREKKSFDRSDKPFNREKRSFDKSDKPFDRERKSFDRSDKPFKKVYRSDERSDDRRDRNTFDKTDKKPYGSKKTGAFGGSDRRKSFNKDISSEEIKSERQKRDNFSDKSEQKPFRKTNKTDNRNERFTGQKYRAPKEDQEDTGAYAFEGKKQTPPEYDLKGFDKRNKGRGKSKSKTKQDSIPDDADIRLNRYIANAGICSRREADVLIESGEIKVNGKVVNELGYKVKPGDIVKYGNRTLSREKMVYVLLNKPKDYITTTEDPEERKTVMELVSNACQERIYPVGRLDRNTTGLLVLTNDGELAEKLSHPSNEIQKLYEVEIDRPITPEDYQAIIDGVELEDGVAKVDDLAIVSPDRKFIGIALHLGRNRIVRRIFEHLGYKVVKLDRTTYAGLTKKDLPRGHWRYLSEKEVIRLKYFV